MMGRILIIACLFISWNLHSQTYTITCVNEDNNDVVICNSCTDFSVNISKGLLFSDGSADKFIFEPVKIWFRGNGNVRMIGPHKDETALEIPINQIATYNTEPLLRAYLEGCSAVEFEDNQDLIYIGKNNEVVNIGIERGDDIFVNIEDEFGARVTTGVLDWNDITNTQQGSNVTLLRGNHTNGPTTGTEFYYCFVFEYASLDGTGNVTQLAIPYIQGAGETGFYYRTRYVGTWSGWLPFSADNDILNEIQDLQLLNDILTVTNNGSPTQIDLSIYNNSGTDDQEIDVVWNTVTKVLSITMEDGNTVNKSLFDLEDRLELNGNSLYIIGNTEPAINLTPYLDNTDDQEIETFSFANGEITLKLENSTTKVLPITELDPVFLLSVAASIQQSDVDNWNNHILNDLDTDPTNELDSITLSQDAAENIVIGGAIEGGDRRVVYVIEGLGHVGTGAGSSSDDQFLDWDEGTNTLSIENGNSVDLTVLKNSNAQCNEVTGVSSSSIVSPVTLPGDIEKRQIYLFGVMMTEKVSMSHILHTNINGQNINFYQNLDPSWVVRVCVQ